MHNPDGPMFRRLVLVCFASCLLGGYSYAQALSIDKFTNQLLFNVFTAQPDPSIQDFLKNYIPALFEKKKKEGVWITNSSKTGQGYQEIHSFVFTKHPFFKPSFTSGKIEFFCLRNGDPKNTQITNCKLWFEFNTQLEAEMAFSNLIDTFMPISTDKKFGSVSGAQKAEFIDIKETTGFGRIRIRLTADNLDHRTFKVLVETDNDL